MTEVSVRRAGFCCRREEGATAELAICAGTAVDQALVVIGGSYAFGRLDAPRRRTFRYPFPCSRSAAGKCRACFMLNTPPLVVLFCSRRDR